MDKVDSPYLKGPHWIIEDTDEFYCSVCNKAYPMKGSTGSPTYGYDPRLCHTCSNCNSKMNYIQIMMPKEQWDDLKEELDSYLVPERSI